MGVQELQELRELQAILLARLFSGTGSPNWQNAAATGALANGWNGPERCTVYGMCRMFFGIFLAHSFFFTIFASSTGTLHDAAFRGGGVLSRTPATLHVLLTF
jgi:hypothetical protein